MLDHNAWHTTSRQLWEKRLHALRTHVGICLPSCLPCSLHFVASLAVPTLNAHMSLFGSREVASVHQIIHENKCVPTVLNGHYSGKRCPGHHGSRQGKARWGTVVLLSQWDMSLNHHFKSLKTNKQTNRKKALLWSGWMESARLLWEEPRNKQANLQDNGVRLILPGGQSKRRRAAQRRAIARVNISWRSIWAALTSTACSRWHCRCESRTAWWGSGSPAKRGHSVVTRHLWGHSSMVRKNRLELWYNATTWEFLSFNWLARHSVQFLGVTAGMWRALGVIHSFLKWHYASFRSPLCVVAIRMDLRYLQLRPYKGS